MDKRDAALDASFWINSHRAGILDFLPSYFNLFVPSVVVEEIECPSSKTGLLAAAGRLFRTWRETGRLIVQDPAQPVGQFDPGENAAIALARERSYVLLIDDSTPYHAARSQGLLVAKSPDLVVMLYDHGKLNYEAARSAIHHLRVDKHLTRSALIALERLVRAKGEKR